MKYTLSMANRISKAVINVSNYKHNIEVIRSNVSNHVKVMAVVKANAYGHGLVEIARAALDAGVDYIGIVSIGELKRLRQAGIDAPCLLLNYLDAESIQDALELSASVTVMDSDFIQAIQDLAHKSNTIVKVHLKVDTGMHRAGCSPSQSLRLAKLVADSPNLILSGIFTHFAESEDVDSAYTLEQVEVFKKCINEIKFCGINTGLVHCANSAATIAHPDTHFDMVRPGVLTYGINPFPTEHPKYEYIKTHFLPVLTIQSKLVHVRQLEIGESVGYNRTWKAEKLSVVALVPIGYGDGYRRSPFNARHVLVAGTRCPIIGNISMDQTIIDVTHLKGVKVNDEVVILGTQDNGAITIDDIAASYQTINYEVVTSLTERLERVYVKS